MIQNIVKQLIWFSKVIHSSKIGKKKIENELQVDQKDASHNNINKTAM